MIHSQTQFFRCMILPSLIFAYNTSGRVPTINAPENEIDRLHNHSPLRPVDNKYIFKK
jgi:hypothetical protein